MKTLTLDEYADLAAEETTEYLIDQFIPLPGRVLLIGPPKEGKSYFGLQLGLAVAKGEPFMGRKSHSAKVLYLQYDTPHKIWMNRAAKLRKNGMTFHPNFHMLDPKDPSYKKTIDVRKRIEDVIYLKEVVEKIQPQLVIIDTLRKMFSGDENSSDIGAEVFNVLNDIFKDQAVVYIHHTHKLSPPPGQKIQARIRPVDALRGSSFYSGEVEAVYLILGNQLISDSRIDESSTSHLLWDKVTQTWSFPDVEKLNKKEAQIRQLYASRSWASWMDFYKFMSHTIPDVPDHLMNRLEIELALPSVPSE